MLNTNNLILRVDSYKASQWLQSPPNTEHEFFYIESRGGDYAFTLFFGLQMFLKEYLCKPITKDDIDEAESVLVPHGLPFNRKGWTRILEKHDGYLPLLIKAAPEGACIPTRNALVTVENTDPEFFWLPSYMETSTLRGVWYPTTVATVSKSIKNLIKEYMEKTCDNLDKLPFMLHDFGARGVSSGESCAIGDAAHLVNFMGTDSVEGLVAVMKYYNCPMPGFSIPASQHSTKTSWGGKEFELDSIRNMLRQFAKPGKMMADVADSYDRHNVVTNYWGKELKQEVLDSGATIVVRPDSGKPPEVVLDTVMELRGAYGATTNLKGYDVLRPCVRVIQGDGIAYDSINAILSRLMHFGYSADNVGFGMGGALLQRIDRDTLNWKMALSAIQVGGKWRNVYKDPITDHNKRSKAGRQMLYRNRETGEYFTGIEAHGAEERYDICLTPVFRNGELLKDYMFDEVRKNSEQPVIIR